MKLMIVESPNKVKKIKSLLGAGWDVAASVGHVRDLPPKTLGVGADYALHYEFNDRGKGVIDGLKPRVQRAEEVYLATDPDREGEAIAWHLKETLKPRAYKRVTFDSITEPVIRKALATPRQLDMNLIHAQEARRAADRLVGYKVSPALSRQTGISSLSAGRVQSVAVRLVVERQREIDAFKETKHFGAEAIFDGGAWKAQWDTSTHLAEGQEYILDHAIASRAALCTEFRVASSETRQATKAPPAPFTTATLLQAASVSLNMKPDETARVAQKLFEQGLITYHRTDSQNFSAEALELIRGFATDNNLPLPAKPRTWKSKDSAQEAHEAIRPTHLDERKAGEDEAQQKLYALIWSRAVASQLADAEYSVNTLRLESEIEGERFTFRAIGRTLMKPGWKVVTAQDAAEDSDDGDKDEQQAEENGKVPALAVERKIRSDSTRVVNKQTQRPRGYTQASLIKALEKEGIGRPSTYPVILSNIIRRGYINDSKKILAPTELGVTIIVALVGSFAFADYAYTRTLEQELDDIASGKAQYLPVISTLDKQLDKELGALHLQPAPELAANRPAPTSSNESNVSGFKCPKCKTGVIRRPGTQPFYSCTEYSRSGCTYKINLTIKGKTLTPKQVEALVTKGKTAIIKGFISTSGKPFDAMLVCSADTKPSPWMTNFEFPHK